ncbi:hypothetical protein LTS18_011309, partial [Coniosporium uncinatum]
GSLSDVPRLSTFWAPTGGITASQQADEDRGTSLLLQAGFIRQAHSGIWHLLPLGLRVQEKIERLVDKHMQSIGASKLSLSSITSEELWRKTGRYGGQNSEFLGVKDRRESGFLLAPTHEEEITALTKGILKSYKDLPLRLYQISRKYRDELRPRAGLLRAKEFLMKDLYTFDASQDAALQTYSVVRGAYKAFFDELGLPYLVAEADSGAMGGNLSHEYQFEAANGEDIVHVCSSSSCGYTANEEASLVDFPYVGDGPGTCPKCFLQSIEKKRAIEVGHTFHLGTRYSEPLDALVPGPGSAAEPVKLQMGCHGIGISRLIGAVASLTADARGLNWPRSIAPFQAVVIPKKGLEREALDLAKKFPGTDIVVDDREKPLPWKFKDAELIGYPTQIVV